jgi:hypothetical protein
MEIKKGKLNYDQSGRAYPDKPNVKENWDCVWECNGKHYKLVGDDEHKEWEEVKETIHDPSQNRKGDPDVILGYKTSIVAQMLDNEWKEPKQETLEEAADTYAKKQYGNSCGAREERKICKEDFIAGAKWAQEEIKQFLYAEICERRPYSSSRMCEEVIKFIEQMDKK